MKILQLFCKNFRIIMYTINIEIIEYQILIFGVSIIRI